MPVGLSLTLPELEDLLDPDDPPPDDTRPDVKLPDDMRVPDTRPDFFIL